MQQDNWFVHAGYTSVATFEGLFLPTPAGTGRGRRIPPAAHCEFLDHGVCFITCRFLLRTWSGTLEVSAR